MQRRRRSKAVPKDIFGNAPKPAPAKKDTPDSPRPARLPPSPVPPPPSVEIKESEPIEPVSEPVTEESSQITEDVVVESQILGSTRRKSIGLRPREEVVVEEKVDEGLSNKAQELIDESRIRAEVEDEAKPVEVQVPIEVSKPKAPPPKPRRNRNSFQPASRAKRLDRSRHMEYKYEMRGLLQDSDIAEEHRSNILGTIWARGERQTVADAKEFISEKREQGILTEEQVSMLKSVVDRYTVRR